MTSKSPPPPSRVKTKSPVNLVAKQQSSPPVRLKTVVRRLPPNLPEAVFWQSVEPWVSDETVSWKLFYPGKLRKKLNKENISSRAYILFRNEERLAVFSREYDGHLFRDKQGNESQAVVEFAPNQKVPPEKKKVDPRHATIQQDEDYLSFVASLQNPQPKAVEIDVDALLAATQPPEEPKTTPLLAALREQKLSAHDKKLAASEATKVHSRKAAAAAAQKAEGTDATPPTGKKGKKGKGTQPAAPSAVASSTPAAANPTSTKHGGASRNRPKPSNAPGPSGATSSATPAAGKEAGASGENEATQRRNRPMLGLQSRHLQAALSGAGVAVTPTSPSSSSSTPIPPAVPTPGTGAVTRPSGGTSRGARGGGGGEKRSNEKPKDGAAKSSGGGRGGKEKSRPRHLPGDHAPPTVLSRAPDATPRILTRQDPPMAAPNSGDPSVRDRAATGGPQEAGGGRGRGGRRGRGQP